ncbi:MAG TPA: 2-hydroxyacyl-CoA dehydratase family protein [Spirochaetota bacterium]|nr:2-hydroxyacyl-CoA dehydratase family protein [Spirochaetota bacterium]HPI22858.1 2-hydroxyacyl-CoA dehydratase family protein [Spirochaetota bacterium]HPU89124.1 2-hydroxyacyl-CoA dehydratase family protein [Spirochaetota bacterium]
MRPETREYQFDWMLWSCFSAASKLNAGTPKEYRRMLEYIPSFRGVVETVLDAGEPGQRFIEICATYLDNVINAKSRGQKTAITTFCFSPAIFYAMDIMPICLEVISVMMTFTYKRGTTEFLDYCNEAGYTETSCSSQRGSIGAYLAGLGAEIDMIVTDTPGVCDTNANAFAFAAAYLDKPFFQLDMPPDLTGERSNEYHRADYTALISFLEQHSGKRLDLERLREKLIEVQKQDEMIAELEELARMVPNPLPVVYNFMVYASRFLFAGMPECTRTLESLLALARQNAAEGKSGISGGAERLRSYFCYIDHYVQNLKLWQMLDANGICYQGNILSRSWASNAPHVREFGTQEAAYTLDTANLDGLIDTMAMLNSRMPMIKSIRGPYDAPNMWLQDTLSLATMYNVDFIVYNGTPGCRNTWGMVKLLARDTEKAGFPTFIMYADAFDERVQSWETTRDRFMEFLNVRRLL